MATAKQKACLDKEFHKLGKKKTMKQKQKVAIALNVCKVPKKGIGSTKDKFNAKFYDNKSKEYIEGEIAHTERSMRAFRKSGDEESAKDREKHALRLWKIYYNK